MGAAAPRGHQPDGECIGAGACGCRRRRPARSHWDTLGWPMAGAGAVRWRRGHTSLCRGRPAAHQLVPRDTRSGAGTVDRRDAHGRTGHATGLEPGPRTISVCLAVVQRPRSTEYAAPLKHVRDRRAARGARRFAMDSGGAISIAVLRWPEPSAARVRPGRLATTRLRCNHLVGRSLPERAGAPVWTGPAD